MTTVCLFGAYDPAYPRHRVIQAGLEMAGVTVREARVREARAFRRYPALAAAFGRGAMHADTVLVPEFRHKDMPLARLLAGRRRVVFDPLVSRHDTLVGDWRIHAPGSAQSRWNRWLDRMSLSLADVVLCDTWAHGALYQSLGVPAERLERVLVGAEDVFFDVAPPPASGPVRVLYVGGFLPLHGVDVMLEAFHMLEEQRGLPEYEIEMAGKGIDFDRARTQAERRGLARVRFPGPLPYAELPATLARAHITLGAFGAGAKTGRVVPHKVYQGLAAGRAVVTGDGEGLREVFVPERDLLAVPRGEARPLAEALARVIGDAELRARLGAEGARRAREVATPRAIGAALRASLEARA